MTSSVGPWPGMPPLHLVLGDYGAALLRQDLAGFGLPGQVHCICDDLGHGPLDDGVARVVYMRACYQGCLPWTHTCTDAFAAWRELAGLLAPEPGRAARDLIVWRGRNVSETVLLAMACWWLRDHPSPIRVVSMPPRADGGTHLGTHARGEVARLVPTARTLTGTARAALAAQLEALRDEGGLRRRWVDEHVVSVPIDAFDDLLIAACTSEWQPAARVVGTAMGRADRRDGLSDVFLCSRLQALLAAGLLEADRLPTVLDAYAVRRLSA